ncbi:MAG: hypothetical protein NT128_00530 [Proteobacteria bacterium]|nr:hypothetical protein [Pseudomonadota bacterium]
MTNILDVNKILRLSVILFVSVLFPINSSDFQEFDDLGTSNSNTSTFLESSISDFVNHHTNALPLKSGADCSKKLITLRLPPIQFSHYVALQKKIAEIIPDESYRPTIDLTLTLANATPTKSIGLLGGMGPLSDCDILTRIMPSIENKVDWNRFAIHLLSAPPPRVFFAVFQGLSYFYKVIDFTTQGHDRYYMLGNKAHLHLKWFERAIGCTWLRSRSLSTTSQATDLVEFVIQETFKKNAKSKVLILEALRSYRSQLYQHYLLKNGISTDDFYTQSQEEAAVIQDCISNVKAGNTDDAGKKISDLVIGKITQIRTSGKEVNAVLCGCTEIPLALKSKWNAENKLLELGDESPVFIDTAELFAMKIAYDINELCKPY